MARRAAKNNRGHGLPAAPPEQWLLAKPLETLDLPNRIKNALTHDYRGSMWHPHAPEPLLSVGDLVQQTADHLLEYSNFGYTSLRQLREWLAEHGLRLKDDPSE